MRFGTHNNAINHTIFLHFMLKDTWYVVDLKYFTDFKLSYLCEMWSLQWLSIYQSHIRLKWLMCLVLSSEYFIFIPQFNYFIQLRETEWSGEKYGALANQNALTSISLCLRHPQLLKTYWIGAQFLKSSSSKWIVIKFLALC